MKKTVIEGIVDFKGFTQEVFKQSQAIVENSNCSTYKLMGYKYLDVRLILNFHDCNEVFDFTFNRGVMEISSFYTKDKGHEENMLGMGQFRDEMERDLPE
jgi:hypothetical protein